MAADVSMHPHDRYERMDEILTPRLVLRPMRRDDAAEVVAWRSDPPTAAMLLGAPPTLEDHVRWFDGPRHGRVDYLVVDRQSCRRIGTVNFKDIDEDRGEAETGTLIGHRPSRGQGLALEAKVAWMLFGFACLQLETVYAHIRADNQRMIALDEGIGYVREGEVTMTAASGAAHTFVRLSLAAEACVRLDVYHRYDFHGFLRRLSPDEGDGT